MRSAFSPHISEKFWAEQKGGKSDFQIQRIHSEPFPLPHDSPWDMLKWQVLEHSIGKSDSVSTLWVSICSTKAGGHVGVCFLCPEVPRGHHWQEPLPVWVRNRWSGGWPFNKQRLGQQAPEGAELPSFLPNRRSSENSAHGGGSVCRGPSAKVWPLRPLCAKVMGSGQAAPQPRSCWL